MYILKGKVIVNADDFGENESINRSILASFKLGLISSTTLMTNRPGFEEACQIAHDNNLIDSIGVHLNITKGQPLTEEIKNYPKFYSNGGMYHSFKGHLLTNEEQRILFNEFQAQIDKCVKAGIHPTHIDSHHGMHNYWDIGKVIIDLALKNNIPAIRLRVNWGLISKKGNSKSIGFFNIRAKSYSNIHNYRIKKSGLAKTKYFCELINVTPKLLAKNDYIEVNSHPYHNDDNVIVDVGGHGSLLELEKRLLPAEHFINYKSIQ
jgi:chitin disaccharide deacetylase